ncbi:unannotated protein [freshwater metagenome]|uniref:Unannotated protein n=1 Tax=freshwater metagenome TaxID=449393 RepID=A0A6J7JCX5_9ZZZZ
MERIPHFSIRRRSQSGEAAFGSKLASVRTYITSASLPSEILALTTLPALALARSFAAFALSAGSMYLTANAPAISRANPRIDSA